MAQYCDDFKFSENNQDHFVMGPVSNDTFQFWQGLRGPYYTPFVGEDGYLYWTNNGQLPNPEPVKIVGQDGRGITLTGQCETVAELPEDPDQGEAWAVGSEEPFECYAWFGEWVDLGPMFPAGPAGTDGTDGVSPEVKISSITGGHAVTIKDADHPSGQTFNVLNGADGQAGSDGVSPAVSMEAITGGTRLTITDKDHPSGQSTDIMNGTPGRGVPAGGTAGQFLRKASGTDYDAEWYSPAAGDVSYDSSLTYASGTIGEELNSQSRQISDVNNGYQNAYLDAKFYDGYYSGSTYTGTKTEGKTSGWGVVVVPVPAGKNIIISGFRAQSGTNTCWLNSSDPADVKQIAWNSSQNNGTKSCVTGWLGISDYDLAGNTNQISIKFALIDDLQGQIDNNKATIADLLYEDQFDGIANVSHQYLHPEDATSGYYYDLSGNTLVKAGNGMANNVIYKRIPVKAGQTYNVKNVYGYFCILDDGGTFSRITSNTTTSFAGSFTPNNNGFIYMTVANAAQLPRVLTDAPILNTVTQDTTTYNTSLIADGFIHIKIAPLDGDYTNPIDAVRSINDASKTKQYMLDIYPGTYDLQNYITSAEQIGSIWGLKLPDYVNMRGIGEHDEIIINCSLPNSSSATAVEYTSTLNLSDNNTLENITFTGTNVRYVVHDESSNTIKNFKRVVKNCKFIHNGNQEGFWSYTYAWGEGCSSGSYSYFEDCIFENNGSSVAPYGFHTNTDFESACTHVFKNCQFIQNYFGSNPEGAFMVDDIQSGKPINIEFVGCTFSRFIFIKNHASTEDIEEINITGHGNNPVYVYPYRPNVTNPKRIFAKFTDEVALVYNPYADVAMGRPLRYASYVNKTVGIVQSNGTECVGIALDTIPQNSIGYMQFAGIMMLSQVGVSGINNGDRVGVNNYSIAAVTDGSEFARAIQDGVIKFI